MASKKRAKTVTALRRKCPLCRANLSTFAITTGNRLKTGRGKVLGVIQGTPRMKALCERGCLIIVRAKKRPASKVVT